MITIALEKLTSGDVRATGRIDGRTVEYFEGKESAAQTLVLKAMKSAAGAHQLPTGGFDMTHISLNEAARVALYPR